MTEGGAWAKSQIVNPKYHREDFAVGSLPAPTRTEFDELVGPPERFAYVDEAGGRHVFPATVEAALRDLAVDDGITVLDEGHPRDLPALVQRCPHAGFSDDAGTANAKTISRQNRSRRSLRRCRRRSPKVPHQGLLHRLAHQVVQHPLPGQGARLLASAVADRRYGFVLFHEKIDKTTLYTLQRDYLDYKVKRPGAAHRRSYRGMDKKGSDEKKRVARDVADLNETLAEVEDFAKTMARIVREGYEPEPNWIDDRVILRMAPLWELVPLWEKYPKKHWKRLQARRVRLEPHRPALLARSRA